MVSVFDNDAVAQANRALRPSRQSGIVGDQYNRAATLAIEFFHQPHNVFARGLIKIAGGFVREQNARCVHECARQRDALLLATRQLLRKVMQAITKPHARQ